MSELIGPDGKPADWWIVSLKDYGITAMPSKQLAENGRDLLRAAGFPTPPPRRANPGFTADRIAIAACKQEIIDEQNAAAVRLLTRAGLKK